MSLQAAPPLSRGNIIYVCNVTCLESLMYRENNSTLLTLWLITNFLECLKNSVFSKVGVLKLPVMVFYIIITTFS